MTTRDYTPGIGLVDDLQFLDFGDSIPEGEGVMAYRDGTWTFRDAAGEFNPRGGESNHEELRTLTHDITATHTCAITRDAGKVSSILWSIDSVAYRKFEILSRSGNKVSTYRKIQYASDGTTILRQLDATITRAGGKVTSIAITRTT